VASDRRSGERYAVLEVNPLVRIAVDTDLCQGHGTCYSFFPELFTPDDEGYSEVVGAEVGDALAHEAASVCPERAIQVRG
jgi:ferredoxin